VDTSRKILIATVCQCLVALAESPRPTPFTATRPAHRSAVTRENLKHNHFVQCQRQVTGDHTVTRGVEKEICIAVGSVQAGNAIIFAVTLKLEAANLPDEFIAWGGRIAQVKVVLRV